MRSKREAAAEAMQRICSLKKRKVSDGDTSSTNGTNNNEPSSGSKANRHDDCEPETEPLADGKISDETDERQDEIPTEPSQTGIDPDFAALDRAFVLGLTLHHAVTKENKRGVEHLLKSGMDPNALDDSGLTPLHHAVRLRNMNLIQLLIDGGADVNHRGGASTAQPIIHEAINLEPHATKPGRLAITRKLVSHGADVKVIDGKGRSTLYCAASSIYGTDYTELLQLLLQHGADPRANAPPGIKLSNSFVKVLDRGDMASVRLFFRYGIKLVRYAKFPLLHRACRNVKNPEVLEFLLASCLFDVNQIAPTKMKEAPLHVAVRYNNPKAVEMLLNWGAQVDIVDEPTGSTPLHLVHYSSQPLERPRELTERCVQILLDHGANVDAIQRCSGKTALEVAMDNFRSSVESLPLFPNRCNHVLSRMWQRKCMLETQNVQMLKEQLEDIVSRRVHWVISDRVHIENSLRMKYHEELNVTRTVQIMKGLSLFDFLLDKSGRLSKKEMLVKLSKSELVVKKERFPSFIERINEKLEELSKKDIVEEEAIEKLGKLTGLENHTFRLILLKIVRELESRDVQALIYAPST